VTVIALSSLIKCQTINSIDGKVVRVASFFLADSGNSLHSLWENLKATQCRIRILSSKLDKPLLFEVSAETAIIAAGEVMVLICCEKDLSVRQVYIAASCARERSLE